jgi:hypothetical protein
MESSSTTIDNTPFQLCGEVVWQSGLGLAGSAGRVVRGDAGEARDLYAGAPGGYAGCPRLGLDRHCGFSKNHAEGYIVGGERVIGSSDGVGTARRPVAVGPALRAASSLAPEQARHLRQKCLDSPCRAARLLVV